MRDEKLFYTCSLIEYISRKTKNTRKDIVNKLQPDLKRIYEYADVFHCEPIEKVCFDFTERNQIIDGVYAPEDNALFAIPSFWEIGKIFGHLIEDVYFGVEPVTAIKDVFSSWLADKIFDYNSDLYYQPRDYLAECYREGKIIDA